MQWQLERILSILIVLPVAIPLCLPARWAVDPNYDPSKKPEPFIPWLRNYLSPLKALAFWERAIFRPDEEENRRNKFFGSRHGFFVEVGANDPVILSQTHALEQSGWDGMLIEPLPQQAEHLRANRSAKVFQFACCAPADAGRKLPFHVAGIYSSLRADLPTPGAAPTSVIEVETRTLDQVLELASAPVPLDFVSIDVEGVEIEVLDGFSLDRWKPRLLVVEDRAIDLELHNYLTARGYRWIKRFALNNWYVSSSSPERPSLFGRLQFFRKYYLGMHLRRMKRNASHQGRTATTHSAISVG